jgi:hypothetical protein
MFVRDASPSRAYVQLLKEYQQNPKTLARELPHREMSAIESVGQNLAIVTWRDIAELGCESNSSDDELTSSIKRELLRRIQ